MQPCGHPDTAGLAVGWIAVASGLAVAGIAVGIGTLVGGMMIVLVGLGRVAVAGMAVTVNVAVGALVSLGRMISVGVGSRSGVFDLGATVNSTTWVVTGMVAWMASTKAWVGASVRIASDPEAVPGRTIAPSATIVATPTIQPLGVTLIFGCGLAPSAAPTMSALGLVTIRFLNNFAIAWVLRLRMMKATMIMRIPTPVTAGPDLRSSSAQKTIETNAVTKRKTKSDILIISPIFEENYFQMNK